MIEAATNARPKRTGFSPEGKESQQGDTSIEDTAPAGVDVADPGIPGRAFARDSIKRCKTSKKPEQDTTKDKTHRSKLGTTACSLRHRTLRAQTRPKSPDDKQTGPTSRTNTSPHPPKDSTTMKGGASRKVRSAMPEEEPKHEDRAAGTTESSMFLTRTEAEASPPRIVGLRGKPPFATATTTSNFTTNKDKSWGEQSSRKHLGGRKRGREVATAMGVEGGGGRRRRAPCRKPPHRTDEETNPRRFASTSLLPTRASHRRARRSCAPATPTDTRSRGHLRRRPLSTLARRYPLRLDLAGGRPDLAMAEADLP
uniref:Uncharacterized protein n=1 Tax=Oryza barthii TaxID=65489 RepID=A0A0D3HBA9_9ORYZ